MANEYRTTQEVVEVLIEGPGVVRATQVIVQVLITTAEPPPPAEPFRPPLGSQLRWFQM